MTSETVPSGDALSNQLDRLESAASRKDAELAHLRAEVELKDLLIKEIQAALSGQEALLSQLAGRIDELERRTVVPSIGP